MDFEKKFNNIVKEISKWNNVALEDLSFEIDNLIKKRRIESNNFEFLEEFFVSIRHGLMKKRSMAIISNTCLLQKQSQRLYLLLESFYNDSDEYFCLLTKQMECTKDLRFKFYRLIIYMILDYMEESGIKFTLTGFLNSADQFRDLFEKNLPYDLSNKEMILTVLNNVNNLIA